MAGEAGAQRAHVVKVNNRPTDWDVTVFTGTCCWQMTARLACGARAVVTATAIIDYSRMIKDTNGPGQCNMAGGAIIARLNVVERFARRVAAVVARGARQICFVMIEPSHYPRGFLVAVFAAIARFYVIIALASGHVIVMATEAVDCNRSMVDVNRLPVRNVVTVGAGGSGRRVILQLSFRQAAVMAFLALGGHTFENRSGMARLAGY